MRRYCKTFYCDDVGERLCCASCRFRRDCGNPCLNHPSRCGLEDLREASAKRRGGRDLIRPCGPPSPEGKAIWKGDRDDPCEKGKG